jgi:hypothetical protein
VIKFPSQVTLKLSRSARSNHLGLEARDREISNPKHKKDLKHSCSLEDGGHMARNAERTGRPLSGHQQGDPASVLQS